MRRLKMNPQHYVNEYEFYQLGIALGRIKHSNCFRVRNRRFRAFFGVGPDTIMSAWALLSGSGYLDQVGPRSLKPIHLLWTFMFLNEYRTEEGNAAQAGCDEKTFREWVDFYVRGMERLCPQVVRIF